MNHLKTYLKLIRKAQKRAWTKNSAPCYVEEHHVFPVTLFGKNDHTVWLTAREHYIAHLLLVFITKKRYGSQHRKSHCMLHAYNMMTNGCRKKRYSPGSSIVYQKLKEQRSLLLSISMSGERNPFFGEVHGAEAIELISNAQKNTWQRRTHDERVKHLAKATATAQICNQKKVEVTHLETNKIYVFDSVTDAIKSLGIKGRHLYSVARGERNHTHGYSARYI